MHDRIGFADVGEKLVAEPFAFGGARHQSGDVDKLDGGRDDDDDDRGGRSGGRGRGRSRDDDDDDE